MARLSLSNRMSDRVGSPLLLCGASALALGVALVGTVEQAHATMLQSTDQQTNSQDSDTSDQATPPADAAAGTSASVQTTQGAAAPQVNDIVVTGFRESLRTAQELKKNSSVIVDSITAEDIGALPDRSVTEALQRVPGVSINRFAAGVDPDHFSVEGSGVTIRGLTYTRSEINGNDAFSAGNGSGINFQDIPSELLAGVDVFKTPSADRIEGGIGGTVNLRTRLPFDQDGLLVSGSAQMNYGDFIKRGSPVFSVLASDRWHTGIGEFGLLGSFSYSQLYSRADRLGITSFRPRTLYSDGTRNDVIPFDGATAQGSILFPRGAVQGSQEFNRQRYGYSAAAQWRSDDGSAEATFRFLRSDARQAWNEHTIEIATDNVTTNEDANGVADSRARAGTSINFDDSGLFESGYITGPTGWRADQQTDDIRTPAIGLQSNNVARQHTERNVIDDYSANLRWDVSDRLGLKMGYQHISSTAKIVDNGLWLSTYQDAYIALNGHKPATVNFVAPQNCESSDFNTATNSCVGTPGATANYPSYFTGSHQSFLDPYNSFYRSAMDHVDDSDGDEDAFRVDLDYAFPDNGFLKSVQVGGRFADRQQTARSSVYNWGELSEQWGNGGPVWLDDNVDGVEGGNGGSPPAEYKGYFYSNFFKGAIDSPAGPGRLFYSGHPATNYDAYAAFATLINREWEPTAECDDGRVINGGWNRLSDRCGNLPGSIFQPGEVNPQSTRNWAAYAMTNIDHQFANGWRLTGNLGVRYTNTRRRSNGFQQFANAANSLPTPAQCAEPVDAGQSPTPFCTFSPQRQAEARAFLNGALNPNNVELNYDYWLPSVNLKLAVSDKLQFRAGYFKGVYDPQFGYSRNYFNITGISTVAVVDQNGTAIPDEYNLQVTTTAGNPALLPTTADNFDLTAEWYFSNVGQFTIAAFYKRLTNVVTNNTQSITLTNNGASFPVIVTQPVNSDQVGKVKGIEASYQQVYDFLPGFLSGLGLQATYTYVDSSGVPQTTLSATDPDVAAGRQSSIPGDQFPLQGLSKHTVNITPFINIGNLELRAAYNWRSRYLLTIRDVITPFDPIFQRAYGQLDASATFTVNDHFKLGVQAVNLTNSVTKTEAAVLDSAGNLRYVPRQWYVNDSRYTIIARVSF